MQISKALRLDFSLRFGDRGSGRHPVAYKVHGHAGSKFALRIINSTLQLIFIINLMPIHITVVMNILRFRILLGSTPTCRPIIIMLYCIR